MMYWLRRHIHPTWHLTAVCAGVVAGVALAAKVGYFWHIGWLGVALVLCSGALYKRWRVLLVASIGAGLLLGLWRGGMLQGDLKVYQAMQGKHVRISGRVASDPELEKFGRTTLKIDEVSDPSGRSLPGTLRVTTADSRVLKKDDRLVIDGGLSEGFGTFVATMDNARLIEVGRVPGGNPALAMRDSFASAIATAVREPAASLGAGYLLGQKQALPQDLQEALVVTGLTHVVVASGYNLTILVRIARRLFSKVSKYLAALTSVGMVGAFMAITGLSPSMTRAGLVSLLSIWAWYYGRKFHPVTLLLLAASATVLWNPSYAWGDIGWLLSFAAFGGVMILAPLLRAYFYGEQKPSVVAQILGETVAAQLLTAPIILVVFGQFSVIAIISNLIVVPFVPLAMLLTLMAGLGALAAPAAAIIVGWPAQLLLEAMVWVVNQTASIPWAQAKFSVPMVGVVVWYGAIVLLCVFLAWKTKYRLRESSMVE